MNKNFLKEEIEELSKVNFVPLYVSTRKQVPTLKPNSSKNPSKDTKKNRTNDILSVFDDNQKEFQEIIQKIDNKDAILNNYQEKGIFRKSLKSAIKLLMRSFEQLQTIFKKPFMKFLELVAGHISNPSNGEFSEVDDLLKSLRYKSMIDESIKRNNVTLPILEKYASLLKTLSDVSQTKGKNSNIGKRQNSVNISSKINYSRSSEQFIDNMHESCELYSDISSGSDSDSDSDSDSSSDFRLNKKFPNNQKKFKDTYEDDFEDNNELLIEKKSSRKIKNLNQLNCKKCLPNAEYLSLHKHFRDMKLFMTALLKHLSKNTKTINSKIQKTFYNRQLKFINNIYKHNYNDFSHIKLKKKDYYLMNFLTQDSKSTKKNNKIIAHLVKHKDKIKDPKLKKRVSKFLNRCQKIENYQSYIVKSHLSFDFKKNKFNRDTNMKDNFKVSKSGKIINNQYKKKANSNKNFNRTNEVKNTMKIGVKLKDFKKNFDRNPLEQIKFKKKDITLIDQGDIRRLKNSFAGKIEVFLESLYETHIISEARSILNMNPFIFGDFFLKAAAKTAIAIALKDVINKSPIELKRAELMGIQTNLNIKKKKITTSQKSISGSSSSSSDDSNNDDEIDPFGDSDIDDQLKNNVVIAFSQLVGTRLKFSQLTNRTGRSPKYMSNDSAIYQYDLYKKILLDFKKLTRDENGNLIFQSSKRKNGLDLKFEDMDILVAMRNIKKRKIEKRLDDLSRKKKRSFASLMWEDIEL